MSATTQRRTGTRVQARRPARAPAGASHRRQPAAASVATGWKLQPWSMRLLRAFLGVTFLYAGVQKLADPNFFHVGSPDYIGNQLSAFANGSPIGSVLRVLDHVPLLTGVAIALTEIAIGVGTLLGVAPVASAVGGFAVSLALTLSATWHLHPYFLGSDSIYAVAWLAYAAGLWEVERRRRGGRRRTLDAVPDVGRRELLRGGVVAGIAILLGGAARELAPPAAATTSARASSANPTRRGSSDASTAAGSPSTSHAGGGARAGDAAGQTPTPSPTTVSPSVQGKEIASLDRLQVGDAVGFDAPGVGPAVLVRTAQNEVCAFSRVCTHAGCLVGYDPNARILVCPCHGAEFDPARHATPIAGPAPTPLQPVKVVLDEVSGQVILPS